MSGRLTGDGWMDGSTVHFPARAPENARGSPLCEGKGGFPVEDPTPAKPHGRQPLETPQYTLVNYSKFYSLLYTAQYTLVNSRNPHTRVCHQENDGGFGVSGPR